MLFKKRIEKVFNIKEVEKDLDKRDSVKLEKSDFTAMLIAAAAIFGPIILGLIGIMFLLGWLFGAFG